MQRLLDRDDVQTSVECKFAVAVVRRREIAHGVERAAVRATDERRLLQTENREIDDGRALVDFRQATSLDLLDHDLDLVGVVGLALERIELYAQKLVALLQLRKARLAKDLPQLARLAVTILELLRPRARLVGDAGIVFFGLADPNIEIAH